MFDEVTLKLNADPLILSALKEDITSEDVSTNAVMPTKVQGTVDLIAKEDGVIAGMDVYARVLSFWMKIQRLRCSVMMAMRSEKAI